MKLKGIKTVNGKLKLQFRDRTKEEADCLIGADRIYGIVRAYLLGKTIP